MSEFSLQIYRKGRDMTLIKTISKYYTGHVESWIRKFCDIFGQVDGGKARRVFRVNHNNMYINR